MKHQCYEFEELIWQCARTGAELPPEAARHMESCEVCRQVTRDAKRIASAVLAAGEIPIVRDCRSAVMSQISGGARRRAGAWAYACAAVLIAGLVATGIVAYRPHSPTAPTRPIVRNTVPSPTPPVVAEKPLEPKRIVLAPPAPRRIHHRIHRKHYSHKTHDAMMAKSDITPAAPTPSPLVLSLSKGASPAPRSVAAVYVTWPEAGAGPSSESYSYIERNSETGETTKGSVKRSGNKVEIYIESTPGGEQPPVKGSIEHESKSNA